MDFLKREVFRRAMVVLLTPLKSSTIWWVAALATAGLTLLADTPWY